MEPNTSPDTRRLAVTGETAFFSGLPWREYQTFPASKIASPSNVGALLSTARVLSTRPGVFTGAFYSLYADFVRQFGKDGAAAIDAPLPLFTELAGTTKLLKTRRVNGHWDSESVPANKIRAGDFVVTTSASVSAMHGLAVTVDVGGRLISAVVAQVMTVSQRPSLRAPIVELNYSSMAPIIADGFSVS